MIVSVSVGVSRLSRTLGEGNSSTDTAGARSAQRGALDFSAISVSFPLLRNRYETVQFTVLVP